MNGSLLLAQAITGLIAGGGYAVVAIGLSYTLGLARVMNFAFGTFYMLAAFAAVLLMTSAGLPYIAATLLAVAACLTLGWSFARTIVLPAMRISPAAVMIATLGASVAMTNLAQAQFGADVSYIATPFAGINYRIAGAAVSVQSMLCVAAAPLLAWALSAFMARTLVGRRLYATAEHPDLASATGINVGSMQVLAVVIGIALAAIAAMLFAPSGVISVFIGDEILLKAFAVTALAGVGRIWGAVLVAFAIGVFEAVVGAFVSTAFSTASIYALLVVMLVFFPKGLFRGH